MPSRARVVVALTVASVLALTSHAAGAEDRGGRRSQASERSGGIGGVRRAARPDAATLAAALVQADRAVAGARGRLRGARERLALTREYKAQATEALIEVRSRIDGLEQTLAARVRDAYMTGNLTGLALVLEADSLPSLLSRTATAGYTAQRERETLTRLEAAVAGRLAELLRVRAARAEAKRALDARAAGLAGATAQARASSQELRRLILQQEQTLALAGGRAAGGRRAGWPLRPVGCLAGRAVDHHAGVGWGPGGRQPDLDRVRARSAPARQPHPLPRPGLRHHRLRQAAGALRAYVRDRYGSAERAKAFWEANGWY